uniref:(northern house mosquito) hypothetical protein n=1 Tax=Culex pipiens TaxID=7175 RepID=A0A8D8D7N4_CULPI
MQGMQSLDHAGTRPGTVRRLFGTLTPAEETHQNRTNRTIGESTADSCVLTEGRSNLAGIPATTGPSPKSIAQAESGRATNGNVNHQQRTKFVLAATTLVSRGRQRQRCHRSTDAVIHDGRATAGHVDRANPTQHRGQNGVQRSGSCRRNRRRFLVSVRSIPRSGHHLSGGDSRNAHSEHRPRTDTPRSPNTPLASHR